MHTAILSGSALREVVSLQMNRHLCDGAERQKDKGIDLGPAVPSFMGCRFRQVAILVPRPVGS